MTLETIALWWRYAFGAFAAILVLAVTALFAIDRLVDLFGVKRAILDWAWHRTKGYELHRPEIVTPKGGGRIDA